MAKSGFTMAMLCWVYAGHHARPDCRRCRLLFRLDVKLDGIVGTAFVQGCISAALGVDIDEVTYDARMVEDLGMS